MNKTKLDAWIAETEGLPELTREALDDLQLRRLNELLQRLKERPGAPEQIPGHLDSLEQLGQLPFTTQQMLAENPGRYLLTSQSEVSRVISGATSGTTGPAKRVFYTQRDTEHTVGFFAAGISEMLEKGEKCLIAFPFTGPFGLGDLIARAVERLGGEPVRAGFGQSWQELAELTHLTRPETFIGFPATLLGLARMYPGDLPIRRALVSGDACPEGVMGELEAVLGSPLYPHYGSRECGLGGAVTCPAFEGMHIRENHILPEIVDERGNVLPEGEWGELVITTLGADAMPLLRYRTGDRTRILPQCPCGGVTKRLDRVSRREGRISMEALDSALFAVPGVVDFQAEFDGELHLDIRCLPGCTEAAAADALRQLQPGLPVRLKLTPASAQDRPLYLGKRFVRSR